MPRAVPRILQAVDTRAGSFGIIRVKGGDMESIRDKVMEIVSRQMGIDAIKISEEDDLISDLGADTLDQCELVMEVENEFDIRISEDDTWKIDTVGDLVNTVEKIVNNKG